MREKDLVEIIEFTDPVCTWCWGSEPLLRKLESRYGDQLKVKYVMGGLVKDIRGFYDSYNDIGGDAEHSNVNIAKHWLEASERHGMPVKEEGFSLFSNEYPSTYPQNIAYKAAQMEDQKLADKFLRRIREASAAEAMHTSKTEILIQLASEAGLNVSKFIERFTDGSARVAFDEDLRKTAKYGVRGFPTFLVRYGEKEVLLGGYQSFESIKSVIKALTEDRVQDSTPENSEDSVFAFIRKYGRVAPIEIKASFDYSDKELNSMIEVLKSKQLIRVIPAGNGFFIEAAVKPLSCNTANGLCNI